MSFPIVSAAAWRAQVEKDLAGADFDEALVHRTAEGSLVQPLYTSAPDAAPIDGPTSFQICMRHAGALDEAMREDLDGGADALWLGEGADLWVVRKHAGLHERVYIVEPGDEPLPTLHALVGGRAAPAALRFVLGADPVARLAAGHAIGDGLAELGRAAKLVADRCPLARAATISTLPYHDAGADAADELAIALSTGVLYLRALLEEGLAPEVAARQLAVRISVGRDTFGELCKLRALRRCWDKLAIAAGARAPSLLVHAVCSSRTLAVRDPWVNMLRVTTQVFAAILGGADLVTPSAFDEALGPPSSLGRRVARNTGLVLREESHLGRVVDPGAGSYYLESHTDALAREAWRRFQAIEREGGIVDAIASGRLRAKLEAAWTTRLAAIYRRKEPILGVSEHAEPAATPSRGPRAVGGGSLGSPERGGTGTSPPNRDAEAFEALRDRADKLRNPEVALIALGPPAEHRARVGFAQGLFPAGGLRCRMGGDAPKVACLCGSDERYAAEAAGVARGLKAAGAYVLLAGKPGALEATLREAGVDAFVFVGCDVVATLDQILTVLA